MNTLAVIAFMVAVVVSAIILLGLKGAWLESRRKKRYRSIQKDRPELSDEAFCIQSGFEPSCAGTVSVIRSGLAEFNDYDRLRIFPEDDFFSHFGLTYDDDVAGFVYNTKLIKGFDDYSFPIENIWTVADFIRVVLEMKQTAEKKTA